jgi:cell division protein FtsB
MNADNETREVTARAKAMLTTIGYAEAHGIMQAYPDSSVAEVISELVAEIERLREERIAEGAYLVKVHNDRADLLRNQANRNRVLDDLIVRMESADRALSGDALTAARETTRSHLTSKSDSVRQALSYVREARNG